MSLLRGLAAMFVFAVLWGATTGVVIFLADRYLDTGRGVFVWLVALPISLCLTIGGLQAIWRMKHGG